MKNKSIFHFTLILSFILLSFQSNAKDGVISGTVADVTTGEALIGVHISYAPGKGVITNAKGEYKLTLPYGEYNIKFSYVGYEDITKTINLKKGKYLLNIKLSSEMLKEVEIVADIARTRETPVAFSVIQPKTLEEELANQDLPLILNRTPGVYATNQGGGDGDARINIRGFSQRNVAVMIDGVPVNDMENGWVYWSNWFGLDQAVRSIQVQRGLSASKLALPSIGGTMNIITRGIDQRRSMSVKQDFGSDGYMRTSLGISTGQLDNGWAVSFAGAYKQGDGWVDQTWSKGYFGYLRIDKKLGKHTLSFSGYGAPQSHGQRAYKSSIAEYSTAYAKKLGITEDQYVESDKLPSGYLTTDLGLRYNPGWGYLNRWSMQDGDTVYQGRQKVSTKSNFYFKPQMSLRDFWKINKKLYMSNIVYMSYGKGGGVGIKPSSSALVKLEDGSADLQSLYNENKNSQLQGNAGGFVLGASMNNHMWVGGLSTLDWSPTKKWNISGGLDLRSYKGSHYAVAHDMLGADLYKDLSSSAAPWNNNSNTFLAKQGDTIHYHNDNLVRWGGLFTQAKWKSDRLSIFGNATIAYTGYKRIDYFMKKDLVIDDEIYAEQVGYHKVWNSDINDYGMALDTVNINGTNYTANSAEARDAQSAWKWLPGYTLKAGANYNFSSQLNAFVNIGYLSKAPRSSNVFKKYSNDFYDVLKNEEIKSAEIGVSYFNKWMTINLNTYYTLWENKPSNGYQTFFEDEMRDLNIIGMDAIHKGIEIELALKPHKNLLLETVVSLGNWTWNTKDSAQIVDREQEFDEYVQFDARGIKVGDAAQTQFRQSLRWEIVHGLSIRASVTYFGNHYAEFNPISLDPEELNTDGTQKYFDAEGNPLQSWKIPAYYMVDAGITYRWKTKDATRFRVQVSVLNLLDEIYISDAQNNDGYIGHSETPTGFDAASAGVFFGMGRRIMTSFSISI